MGIPTEVRDVFALDEKVLAFLEGEEGEEGAWWPGTICDVRS